MKHIVSVILFWQLSTILTACSPCSDPDPVTYYIKFKIVDKQGTDWFVRHNQYRPDSVARLIPISSGNPVLARCPFSKESESYIFDCDVTFGSRGPSEKIYYIQLRSDDVDTLSLRMTTKLGNSPCNLSYTNAVTLFYNNVEVVQVDSEKNHDQWIALVARQFTAVLTKND